MVIQYHLPHCKKELHKREPAGKLREPVGFEAIVKTQRARDMVRNRTEQITLTLDLEQTSIIMQIIRPLNDNICTEGVLKLKKSHMLDV